MKGPDKPDIVVCKIVRFDRGACQADIDVVDYAGCRMRVHVYLYRSASAP